MTALTFALIFGFAVWAVGRLLPIVLMFCWNKPGLVLIPRPNHKAKP